jgi:hypothetical protein
MSIELPFDLPLNSEAILSARLSQDELPFVFHFGIYLKSRVA